MDLKTYLVGALKGNVDFVAHTLGDFTDADMFVRPCPGANHAAWQLGHLINAETSVQKQIIPGHAVTLPDGFTKTFDMEANKIDDASKFAPFNTKAQLLELFSKVREATAAGVAAMTDAQLQAASPEKFKMWAPTIDQLLAGQITPHIDAPGPVPGHPPEARQTRFILICRKSHLARREHTPG